MRLASYRKPKPKPNPNNKQPKLQLTNYKLQSTELPRCRCRRRGAWNGDTSHAPHSYQPPLLLLANGNGHGDVCTHIVCQCQVSVVCSIIIYYLYLYRMQDTGTGIHVRRTRGTEHGELEFEIFNSALRWALPFVLFKFLAVPVLLLQGPMPCAVMCGICSCWLLCCCC